MLRLILYEYRKLFLKKSILIAVLIFSIINIIKIDSVYKQNAIFVGAPEWESVYWQVYDNFSGKMTNEKIDKLLKIYRPLEEKITDRTASTRTDDPNTYTGNVYSDSLLFRWMYVQPMEYAYMYQNSANGVVKNALENMEFFKKLGNDYEYKKNAAIVNLFLGRKISDFEYLEMYQHYTHYDFSILLILFICLYGIVNVFVSEKETKMDIILLSTPLGGEKTITAKIIATVIFIITVSLWFLIMDFIVFSAFFHSLTGASLPIYVIQNFVASSVDITLWQYAIISGIVKIIGMLVLGMIFLFISGFFKNALLPFIVNLILAFGFILWGESYIDSCYILPKVVNPFMLLINRELFGKTEFVNILGFPVLSYIAAIAFAICLCILTIILIYIFSKENDVNKTKGGLSCK